MCKYVFEGVKVYKLRVCVSVCLKGCVCECNVHVYVLL